MSIFVLIPAAGLGQRFVDAGYTIPKPLLQVAPDEEGPYAFMLGAVAANALSVKPHSIVAGVPWNYWDMATEKCNVVQSVPIYKKTLGQAETVLLLADLLPPNAEVLVINSDQITNYPLDGFVGECKKWRAEAGVLTMTSQNPAFSYVRTTSINWVVQAREKEVISTKAVAGFYWFRSAKLLKKVCRMEIDNVQGGVSRLKEAYLTPTLNYLSAPLAVPMGPFTVTSFGTPEEYEKNRRD